MNNPNPLLPQGSLLEQKAKAKPHLRVAYIIVAVHLVFLGGLLIQGCKKEDQPSARAGQPTNDSALPPLDQSNLYPTNAATSQTNPQQPESAAAPPVANSTLQSPAPTSATDLAIPAAPHDYVVIRGDTFSSIGKKFNLAASAIAKANPGVDPTRLKVGQKLVVPASASPSMATAALGNAGENLYVVKTGDTLLQIAKVHGTTVTEVKTLNGLKTDRIKVGDKLKLPASKSAPAAATPAASNPGTPTSAGGTGNI